MDFTIHSETISCPFSLESGYGYPCTQVYYMYYLKISTGKSFYSAADYHFRRSGLCNRHSSHRRTPPPFQPCQSHCRPRTYRQRKTWRWFRLSLLPCFQLFWFSVLSGVPVPQTLAQYFHLYMGNR